MTPRAQIALVLLPLMVATVLLAAPQQPQPAPPPAAALTDAQVSAMVKRAIAMQHRADDALDEYDRTERIVDLDDKKTNETVSRLVPVGGGEMRVDLNRDGKPVPPDEIAQKWREVAGMMESRTHLNDPAVKKEYEKAAKRKSDTAKMVDAINDAFHFHFVGRSVDAGRQIVELDFEPNPDFKSTLRFSGIYKQIYGKVWVDEASGYVTRMQAELRQDIPIGGGIVGKVYKGAHMEIQQSPTVSGIWLPTFSAYDAEGRKFLFPASFHRKVYASRYRHIGPPAEALALLRNEPVQPLSTTGP